MPKIRTTSPSIFSKNIVELRKSRQLTQQQFADQIGLSLSTVAYYESAAKNPKLETVYKIANFFKVSPATLITDEEEYQLKPGPIPRLNQQLQRIKDLSPHKQKLVSELLETFLQNA